MHKERPKAMTKFRTICPNRKGKELLERVQLAREAEWQKRKKKQFKTINGIVNGTHAPSQSRKPPLPSVGVDQTALELQSDEI